jgi:hypothetical protein
MSTREASAVLGVGTYPFNLTTPNYTMHMSLNFSYELTNAAIVAAVVVGDEVAFGVVTPHGTVRSPTVGPFTPLGSGGVAVSGQANGLANFEFEMKPLGADSGTLYLILVPSRPVQQLAGPVASATVDDMSFELDTWQRVLWPANLNPGHGMGHLFEIDPNYSTRQMSHPGCRAVSSGGVAADVCEDWQVMIHSPGDDAETVDLEDVSGSFSAGLRAAGSQLADPQRGVTDFSSTLAFVLPGPDTPADVSFTVANPFRTNGRFWEQLVLTRDVLAMHPDTTKVEITDNLIGRDSILVSHVLGGAPVAPYVPFESGAVAVDPLELVVGEASGGVPEVSITLPSSSGTPVLEPAAVPARTAPARAVPSKRTATKGDDPRSTQVQAPVVRVRRR